MAEVKQCFIPVLMWEGLSAECDPDDYGGYTLAGISQVYNPELELWKMNLQEYDKVAKAIEAYYRKIWNYFRLSEIDSNATARQIFQAAFNCWSHAIRWAQEVCNEHGKITLDVDGVIGGKTIAAINGIPSYTFRKHFCEKQKKFYYEREASAIAAKTKLEKNEYATPEEKAKLEKEAMQGKFTKGLIARAEYFAR